MFNDLRAFLANAQHGDSFNKTSADGRTVSISFMTDETIMSEGEEYRIVCGITTKHDKGHKEYRSSVSHNPMRLTDIGYQALITHHDHGPSGYFHTEPAARFNRAKLAAAHEAALDEAGARGFLAKVLAPASTDLA